MLDWDKEPLLNIFYSETTFSFWSSLDAPTVIIAYLTTYGPSS